MPDILRYGTHDLTGLVACKVRHQLLPATELQTHVIAGQHGERLDAVRLGARRISVDMYLRHDRMRDAAAVRHALAAALWSDTPQELVLPDDPTICYMAAVEDATGLDTIASRPGHCEVTFFCPSPAGYGALHTEQGTTLFVDIGGNYPTYVTVESTSSGSWTMDATDSTGHTMRVVTNAQGAITVDTERERIYKDRVEQPVSMDTHYSGLLGDGTYIGCSADATVTWRERWI